MEFSGKHLLWNKRRSRRRIVEVAPWPADPPAKPTKKLSSIAIHTSNWMCFDTLQEVLGCLKMTKAASQIWKNLFKIWLVQGLFWNLPAFFLKKTWICVVLLKKQFSPKTYGEKNTHWNHQIHLERRIVFWQKIWQLRLCEAPWFTLPETKSQFENRPWKESFSSPIHFSGAKLAVGFREDQFSQQLCSQKGEV